MPLGYFRALAVLHKTFSHLPAGARLHILGRFLTCPFLRTLDVVPDEGVVLDIGSGHGTYPRLLVEERRNLRVVAVEPDLRKSLLPISHPRIRFVAAFDDAIRGQFDTIVIYDVIYRLGAAERDALFARVADRLRPGGTFVLKDLDPEHGLKHAWNRMQETISDRFLGLTLGEGFNIETPRQIEERMTGAGLTDFRARHVDAGYPHAHVVYTARKPEGQGREAQ